MIEICALASGSNGNCYYIGNMNDAILIDVGISARQLMKRFESRNLNPTKVSAIFLTHEHSDHSRGVQVLSKRFGISVWITSRTYYSMPKNIRPPYPKFFIPGETITVGSFDVHTFAKNHDAAEPCSFRIEHSGKNIGVFTDIGEPCEHVKSHVQQCHAVFMEANYDEKMLWEGRYPYYLKARVASSVGHLSNIQAVELMHQHAHPQLECIFLSHLSQENNTPDLALSSFSSLQQITNVKLTSRYEAGEVYKLEL